MVYSLKYRDSQFSVIFTQHTRDTRPNETVPRDALIYPQMVEKLLLSALINGLTSFRNKGEVVVTARIGEEYAVSLLLNISNDSIITIQSVLTHPFVHYYVYYKYKNRINLWNLVFPSKTVAEVKALRITQKNNKKPKNFKKTGTIKMKLDYEKGTAAHRKNEIDTYTTTYNHKRRLD